MNNVCIFCLYLIPVFVGLFDYSASYKISIAKINNGMIKSNISTCSISQLAYNDLCSL